MAIKFNGSANFNYNVSQDKFNVSSLDFIMPKFSNVMESKSEDMQTENVDVNFLEKGKGALATVTDFFAHAGKGALDTLEQMLDGAAMAIVGDVAIPIYKLLDKLDIEEIVLNGEKIEIGNADKTASELEEQLQKFVERDLTQEAWDAGVGKCEWIKEYSTCSTGTRELAEGIGTMGSYIGLSMVPYAGPAFMGLGAGGSAAENAYKNGATYEEASAVFNVAAIAGFVTDGALNKIGSVAKGAKTMKGAMKAIGLSGLTAEIEPLVNGLTQYFAYGRNQKDESGNYLYKDGISGLNQFFNDNGFYTQMVIAGGSGIVRGFMSRLKFKSEGSSTVKGNDKAVDQIMESDVNISSVNHKSNLDLINNNNSISVPEQRIKDFEKAFELDYYNDPHDKKIIDALYSVILNDDISDENVAKIINFRANFAHFFASFSTHCTNFQSTSFTPARQSKKGSVFYIIFL